MNLQTDGIVLSFVTAILFGLYLASFAHCARWLLFEDEGWRARKKINWALVATTLLVFFLSATSFSMTAASGQSAYEITYNRTHVPASVWIVTIINSHAIHLSILIIIDSVLIHRCWIVYSKNWFIICFPLALWCSCLVCAIIALYCDKSFVLRITDSAIRSGKSMCQYGDRELLAFYVFNIVASIYTTAALVFKIWYAAKNNVGTNHLHRTSRILTESGILYTLSSGVSLAYLIEHRIVSSTPIPNSYFVLGLLSNIAVPIGTFMPGIAFNLIAIRVGEQRARRQDTWVHSEGTSEVLTSGLPNYSDTLTQKEVESTDLGQEGHERTSEGVKEINGTGFGEIMEVVRTPEAAVVRTCQESSE